MRPDVTLIGLTTNKKVARQNVLTWGTFMDVVDKISSSTEMVDRACRVAKSRKILKNGDIISFIGGFFGGFFKKASEEFHKSNCKLIRD
mgnify:CR=1 FL=1